MFVENYIRTLFARGSKLGLFVPMFEIFLGSFRFMMLRHINLKLLKKNSKLWDKKTMFRSSTHYFFIGSAIISVILPVSKQ